MADTDDLALYEAALALAKRQAMSSDDGSGVAACAATASGALLGGVWVDAMVDSACLCAETGPICQAHVDGERIVASICVQWRSDGGAKVLAACGVCQERLAIFGTDVRVAVADDSAVGYRFLTLAELRPSPWWDAIEETGIS